MRYIVIKYQLLIRFVIFSEISKYVYSVMNLYIYPFWCKNRGGIPEGRPEIISRGGTPFIKSKISFAPRDRGAFRLMAARS
jgi:hypothetical protein